MRLLFPEAEVTKSLSSNLLKSWITNVQQDDTRVIDTNTLVARRMETLAVKTKLPEEGGFVAGVQAQSVDAEAIAGENTVEGTSGNVIKAREELPAAEEQAKQLKEEAERILQEAKAEAEHLLATARAEASEEKSAILEEARKQGYEEGLQRAHQESVRLKQEAEEEKKQLEAAYEQLLDELEPQFIATITDIYEHIFHVELSSYHDILVYLICNTIHKAEGNRSFMVHVSKEDYPYVGMQKKQLMAAVTAADSSLEVVEDIALGKNDCLIETDNGIFDCGLDTQLAELKKKLSLLSYEK